MARAGLTPDKIALAGAELADELGFEHVTVSEIARRFDVKTASLYSHVAGSADLRVRIALVALEELADLSDEAVAGRAGHDALVALGHAYRDYATEHPGRYDAARHPLDTETAAASAGPRLSRALRAALRGYGLAEPQETHAVRLVGSLFHGFISLERSGGFDHSEPTSAESWTTILQTSDAMLRGWTTASTMEAHERSGRDA